MIIIYLMVCGLIIYGLGYKRGKSDAAEEWRTSETRKT